MRRKRAERERVEGEKDIYVCVCVCGAILIHGLFHSSLHAPFLSFVSSFFHSPSRSPQSLARRALRCKEALLLEQAALNALAQHCAAVGEAVGEGAQARYAWVGYYLGVLDKAIALAFNAMATIDPDNVRRDRWGKRGERGKGW